MAYLQSSGSDLAIACNIWHWLALTRLVSWTWVKRVFILPRIDTPIVNLNIYFFDHRVGFDRGLTSSYSRAG